MKGFVGKFDSFSVPTVIEAKFLCIIVILESMRTILHEYKTIVNWINYKSDDKVIILNHIQI